MVVGKVLPSLTDKLTGTTSCISIVDLPIVDFTRLENEANCDMRGYDMK